MWATEKRPGEIKKAESFGLDTDQIYDYSTPTDCVALLAESLNGKIVAWDESTQGPIPDHMTLCDGENGTPDMQRVFVMARDRAVNGLKVKPSYDRDVSVTDSQPGHNHNAKVENTSITGDTTGLHKHSLNMAIKLKEYAASRWFPDDGWAKVNNNSTYTHNSCNGDPHGHSVKFEDSKEHNHEVDDLPPFYALCYVMFNLPVTEV